jgi:probable rRNA maturation factor
MFKYQINDDYCALTKELKDLFALANNLVSKTSKQNYVYDIVIVGDTQIKKINKQYRHIDKTTDVISFALHDAKGIKTQLLGEIYINYQEAKRTKYSFNYEMTFLLIHGLLHLLGHDHNNQIKEKKMFAMQNKLMRRLNLLK